MLKLIQTKHSVDLRHDGNLVACWLKAYVVPTDKPGKYYIEEAKDMAVGIAWDIDEFEKV
jgi:hypothetical protein